jgi:hypothetical protein
MARRLELLAFTAALLAAPPAAAAGIAITATARSTPLRDPSVQPDWINRADCEADSVLQFAVQATGMEGDNFEVWVGGAQNDCSMEAARYEPIRTCWQVFLAGAATGEVKVNIRARDIVGQHREGGPGSGTVMDCDPTLSTTAGVQIVLWFMAINPANSHADAFASWQTVYDLLGPTAPSNVRARGGEGAISVQWDQSIDTDVESYLVFCDPAPAVGANTCAPTSLAQGSTPDLSLLCGGAPRLMDQKAWIDGLTPGAWYSVGVASIDKVQNIGPLSNVACASPMPVSPQSGAASGCAISAPRGCPAAAAILAAMLALLIRLRLRLPSS